MITTRPVAATMLTVAPSGSVAPAGSSDEITVPAEGSRRERAEAVLRDHAQWIERIVATAPEQWWTLLFPVWEDIT